MANEDHLILLRRGNAVWTDWRRKDRIKRPDLVEADLAHLSMEEAFLNHADLRRANLRSAKLRKSRFFKADLSGACLRTAVLSKADLSSANLRGADLENANFVEADLTFADLSGANLAGARLTSANLMCADFTNANLTGASLRYASMARTKFTNAKLDGCSVYGASVWDVVLAGASQNGLVITPGNQSAIVVDNLNVAQFIYLLLANQEIRNVIDTIASKVVLILGRFTPKRKAMLDALRHELRNRGYSPVLFDFEKPAARSYRETVSTLAHMARFIVVDLTGAKVVLQELERVVPALPSVPVQPIQQRNTRATVVVGEDYSPYPWFLPVVYYREVEPLAAMEDIIAPAESILARRRQRFDASVQANASATRRTGVVRSERAKWKKGRASADRQKGS